MTFFFSMTPFTAAISPMKVFPDVVGLEMIRLFPSRTWWRLMALSCTGRSSSPISVIQASTIFSGML